MKLQYGKTGAEKGCANCIQMHIGIGTDEQGCIQHSPAVYSQGTIYEICEE